MTYPIQILYRGCETSEALSTVARDRAEQLGQSHPEVLACRITVELPHHHHQHGNLYSVHIEVSLAGCNLLVTGSPTDRREHEDPYLAVRDAFDVAERRLEERFRRARALRRASPRLAEKA